jgi:hypothetical protein
MDDGVAVDVVDTGDSLSSSRRGRLSPASRLHAMSDRSGPQIEYNVSRSETADLETSSQAGRIPEWTASTCQSEPARGPRREFNAERVL